MMTTLIARSTHLLAALLAAALLAACGGSSDASQSPVSTDRPVAVTFRGLVGGDPFSCTTTYAGIGTAATPAGRVLTPVDFRYYVHDVRLVNAAGAEVPVVLAEDGVWQHSGISLLDFENGQGTCVEGNAGTNDRVVGTVPQGSYIGLRFKVGVPFALNHLKADNQPAPLNYSAMFWSWTSGYRFMRIEGKGAGAVLHLGSTNCHAVNVADPRQGVSACDQTNVVDVRFDTFDVDRNKVVLDLKDLWDATDLTTNVAGAVGCMSAPNDPECAPVFPKLGLGIGATPAGTQTLFTKE